MARMLKTSNIPTLICRLSVGLIFISEGVLKFLSPEMAGSGRFAKIGFSHPVFWAHFTACFEIICGSFVLIGLLTRFAVIPLLIIMMTAFVTTKWPILMDKGFLDFAHEYRTDFAMTLLLIFFLIYGGGRKSIDMQISQL